MSFTDLPPQTPMFPLADAYAEDCLRLSLAASQECAFTGDIAYGDDYWQKVDVYAPREVKGRDMPVLLFLHGGGWARGYKEWCGFMAPPIVAFPAIFVSVSYRLIQDAAYPGPLLDSIAALRWAYDHIGEFGGSRDRLFVGGHSAGGQIAALMALEPERLVAAGMPADVMKGCFPISGQFGKKDVVLRDAAGAILRVVPIDPPLAAVKKSPVPFYLTWGGQEDQEFKSWGADMTEALHAAGNEVDQEVFAEDDHFQIHLKTRFADNPWTLKVRSLMGA